MSNRPLKNGSFQRGMISMSIEVVPTKVREIGDISFCYCPPVCNECVANLQLLKVFSERMLFILDSIGPLVINIRHCSNCIGMSLQCDPLHVMMYPANAAHLFPTTGTARATMNQ